MATKVIVVASLLIGMGHLVGASVERAQGQAVERTLPPNQDNDRLIAQLGPSPFLVGFSSLTELVHRADAIVVGHFQRTAGLKFANVVDGTSGEPLLTRGWATYELSVSQVVWSRSAPLHPGDVVELQMVVGREEALAVRRGGDPIAAGDECLLFLLRDDVRRTWELVTWQYQFRRAKSDDRLVERLGAVWNESARQWLGGVPLVVEPGGPTVQWNTLLASVEAISAQR